MMYALNGSVQPHPNNQPHLICQHIEIPLADEHPIYKKVLSKTLHAVQTSGKILIDSINDI